MFSVNNRSLPCLFSLHSSGFRESFTGDTLLNSTYGLGVRQKTRLEKEATVLVEKF